MKHTVDQNNPQGSGVTYFHEHGHYIDDTAGGISKKHLHIFMKHSLTGIDGNN